LKALLSEREEMEAAAAKMEERWGLVSS